MKVLIAASISLILGAVFIALDAAPGLRGGLAWSAELALLKDVLLVLLSAYLVVLGLGLSKRGRSPAAAEPLPQVSAPPRAEQVEAELVQLLSVLQERGRLVDFLMSDVAAYSDAQVGAAARVVQQGCAKALREYFEIQPVADSKEGELMELAAGFDGSSYRLLGTVSGSGPFRGTLRHKGWRVSKVTLPRVLDQGEPVKNSRIISPAEVEVA